MLGVENSIVIMVMFQSSRRPLSLWEELQYKKVDLNWGQCVWWELVCCGYPVLVRVGRK